MYRNIIGQLKEWKDSEHRKPLVLAGARQMWLYETGRNVTNV